MKSTALLSVRNLCVSISKIPILKNISFDLKENEILGFVGESGSGKSITAFSIINLLRSKNITKTGTINYNGSFIESLGANDLEKIRGNEISIIFQEPMSSINLSMKWGEQLLEIIYVSYTHLTLPTNREVTHWVVVIYLLIVRSSSPDVHCIS